MNGLAVRRPSSLRCSISSLSLLIEEKMVSPRSSTAWAALMAASSAASRFLILTSFSIRGIAFSMVWRSARISSVLMVSMSEPGSTLPSTWMTSGSSNTRTTWAMASASRMLARNLLPRPSPSDAPFTMPAMSTKDTGAGSSRWEPKIAGQLGEPRVRQVDDTDVGLDRGERVVRCEHLVAGQCVEKS